MISLNEELRKVFEKSKDPFTDIYGQEGVKHQIKSALLMGRHIIIMGPPGIGKTTLAKNVARLLPDVDVIEGCSYHCSPDSPACPKCRSEKQHNKVKIKGAQRFIRLQGSPDLTAEDLLGDIDPIKAMKFGPLSMEAFTPGKIFKANNGILFFDEVNRCPEKLQNALLQVLEEKKATIGSYDVDIDANFIFIGTMNPRDTSTEKLSDVFLDRFDMIYMGYPETLDIERKIVKEKGKKIAEFNGELLDMAVGFVRHLRESKSLEKFPSVRASIGLYERAQSNAFLKGRKTVEFADVEEAVLSVIAHRIKLKPNIEYLQSPSEMIKEEFKKFTQNFERPERERESGDVP